MKLFSNIPIPKSNHSIDYHSKIIAFGSCFAENMGAKFQYFKFQNTTNPFGILFHPLAIEKVVISALSEKKYTQEDLFFLNERWHCFDVHSKMSQTDKLVMLAKLNDMLIATRQKIIEATHCIITLGTAWVYKHKPSKQIVANCHKVPQKEFEKQLLSIIQIEKSLENIVMKIKELNPTIHFIFTISPVRHLKDGFVENQRSKAHLIAALHQLINKKNHPSEGWGYYFPAFELMMDELRDYRFYATDLVHPSELAIAYIWEAFTKTYFSQKTIKTKQQIEAIQKKVTHRPFDFDSKAHQMFLDKITKEIAVIHKNYPHIQF